MIEVLIVVIYLFLGYMLFQGKEQPSSDHRHVFDAIHRSVGIHIIDAEQDDHTYYPEIPDRDEIKVFLQRFDIENREYLIVVVPEKGVSLTVSGVLDSEHGVGADYKDLLNGIFQIAQHQPTSRSDIERLISLFIEKDAQWKNLYKFE